VAVADLEQGAAGKDRDIQRAARHQLAIVEIAGVTPGRIAADASGLGAGATPMLPKKGRSGIPIPGANWRGHPVAVEWG